MQYRKSAHMHGAWLTQYGILCTVLCMVYSVRCMLCTVWCIQYGMVHGILCMAFCVWCMQYGVCGMVGGMVYGAWYIVQGVCIMVYGAWYMHSMVGSMVGDMKHLLAATCDTLGW